MAYNNGFPMSYQQFYQPQYQPYGGYQNSQQMAQAQMTGTNQQTQMMTPPTIHADIIQVGNDQEAESQSVAVGAVQMMMARDDSAIYIKSAYPNNQYRLDIYRKEPIRPQKCDADYVTKDELADALKALKTALKAKNEGVEK